MEALSDTLHLYLQGPKGCTQSSGILHLALSNTICSCFSPAGLEETEKTIRKGFTFCLQWFMTPETCVGFLSREFVSISASSCFCSEVIILGELFFVYLKPLYLSVIYRGPKSWQQGLAFVKLLKLILNLKAGVRFRAHTYKHGWSKKKRRRTKGEGLARKASSLPLFSA